MGITTASVPHVGGCDVSVIRQNVIVVVYSLGPVRLFATPWTVALRAPLSMGFPSQKYWSGLPFPSPGDLPYPRIDPHLLHWEVDSLPLSHLGSPNKTESDEHGTCWVTGL